MVLVLVRLNCHQTFVYVRLVISFSIPTQEQPPPVPTNQPPKYPPPRPTGGPPGQQQQRLGTPNPISPLVHTPGIAGAGGPQAQLSVPDPFTRKISRLPKKMYTQSSSRFAPQKPPSDYKPLPLLKGEVTSAVRGHLCYHSALLTSILYYYAHPYSITMHIHTLLPCTFILY